MIPNRSPRRRGRSSISFLLAAGLGLAGAVLPAAQAQAAPWRAETCLTGTLQFDYHDAESGTSKPVRTQVARNANWELWGTPSGARSARQLAAGITSADDGTFDACYGGSLTGAYLRFTSASTSMWRVITSRDGDEYSFTRYANGNHDLGTVQVPAEMQDAWKIVDTLNLLYWKRGNPTSACWTARQATGNCDELTMVWDADSDDGGYWDYPGTNYVILAGDMPDSKHLFLHEAGHWLQWQLYGRDFPRVTRCNPHYIEQASSPSCAWTEGFADAVAAYTMGDHRYVFDSGYSFSFVPSETNVNWDDGDSVQGRVGLSLLRFWAADGPDGGDWDRDITAMTSHFSQDFEEYFTEDRADAGLPTDGQALQIINDNTIYY